MTDLTNSNIEYFNDYYYSPLDNQVEEVELHTVHLLVNASLIVCAIPSYSKTLTFYSNSPNFEKAKVLVSKYIHSPSLTAEQVQELIDLEQIKAQITSWGKGNLKIQGDTIVYNNEVLPESIDHFLLKSFQEEQDFDSFVKPWENFLEKLVQTQSMEVYNTLHNFLIHNDLKINEDGDILAYKVVTTDFRDKYTGKIDNSLGKTVTEDRRKISSNPDDTCSFGLHACSLDYLRNCYAKTGDQLIEITVDIRDIVCVPSDYKGTKIRVAKYKVTKVLGIWGVEIF